MSSRNCPTQRRLSVCNPVTARLSFRCCTHARFCVALWAAGGQLRIVSRHDGRLRAAAVARSTSWSRPHHANLRARSARRPSDFAANWPSSGWASELPPWPRPCPIRVMSGRHLGAGGATSFTFINGQPRDWDMEIQGSQRADSGQRAAARNHAHDHGHALWPPLTALG